MVSKLVSVSGSKNYSSNYLADKMTRKIDFSIFTVGFTANLIQIILLRELISTFYGNELSVGLMFTIWLLFTALGSGIIIKFIPVNKLFFYRFYSLY